MPWLNRLLRRSGAALCCLCLALPGRPVYAADQYLLYPAAGDEPSVQYADFFSCGGENSPTLYPGAEGEYSFTVRNGDDEAIDYGVFLEDDNLHGIPVEYRITGSGVETPWLPAGQHALDDAPLDPGCEASYTLYWRWQFTTGDEGDRLDTSLGWHPEAVQEGAYALRLVLIAERDEDQPGHTCTTLGSDNGRGTGLVTSENGGVGYLQKGAKTGDIRWAGLLFALPSALVLLALLGRRRRAKGGHTHG